MREILFRGQKIDNGEWVYGSYVNQYGCHEIMLDGVDSEYGFDHYHVSPETVGQYTGLKDKNGKRIFEGDILKTCNGAWEWMHEDSYDIRVSVVGFEDGSFVLDDTYSSDGYNELSCVHEEYACSNGEYEDYVIFEVIGNIYDNPELLKGEK